MDKYDSSADTMEHIAKVVLYGEKFTDTLRQQLEKHDASKLREPEKSAFDQISSALRALSYGTPEYKRSLESQQHAISEHYKNNTHHPEHYKDGVSGMNLFDIIEMLIDWKAASERTKNGDFETSLSKQKKRFDLSPQLVSIFENTAKKMKWL